MRIFITVGTGFIGGNLVRCPVSRGHDVVCLVRTTSDIRELEALGVTLCPGDGRWPDRFHARVAESRLVSQAR